MFCFGGRRANMELQLPLVRRILDEHPDVEYHLWNLARNAEDAAYLNTIAGDRITVLNDFYGTQPWLAFNDIYRHYAAAEFADRLFVKLDDDVVFIQTDRFSEFIEAIEDNRGCVVSAKVINNGACTPIESDLHSQFATLGIPLLDVHLSGAYAEMCHHYLLNNWVGMINQPTRLIATEDWLSINLIGYDWRTGVRIADRLGTPTPELIAGRNFSAETLLGDEGMVNTLPRLVLEGFLAAHLYFGPQQMSDALLADLRAGYAHAGQRYLEGEWAATA